MKRVREQQISPMVLHWHIHIMYTHIHRRDTDLYTCTDTVLNFNGSLTLYLIHRVRDINSI